jgi:hypothetical protein
MNKLLFAIVLMPSMVLAQEQASPADHLPPHITRLTYFGERADFSHDGKRIIFIKKTFGDVFEIEVATKIIRPLTHHYHHSGYTRALYLANGDVLLSGAKMFDPEKPGRARSEDAELWILDKSFSKPPTRLGEKCSEGPAPSRKRMHIAWTIVASQYPDKLKPGQSQIWTADVEYENGKPKLVNKTLALDSTTLPFKCTLECQNFRPPEEKELTFSAYGYQGTDVSGVNLETGRVTNYSNAPNQYDEPEGIFPDGQYTLVECDHQNRKGPGFIDIWKLKLDGSGEITRLTYFSDTPGYKASNPVVSDDGRWMAFQMARSTESAGVGHGIFIYDLEAAPKSQRP